MAGTLYEQIGVDPSASNAEIEGACLRLGAELLARTDPASKMRFADVERAYEILRDPRKRDAYDEQFLPLDQLFRLRGDRFEPRTWQGAVRFDRKSVEISRKIMDLDGTPGATDIVARLQRELEDRESLVRRDFERRAKAGNDADS
jgi:DnaJ-class molecular chaperone